MTKTILKTTLMAALSLTLFAQTAQTVSAAELVKVETTAGKALYYNRYTAQEMQQAGCQSNIYDAMVSNYLTSRGAAHSIDAQARNEQMARQAPGASPTATGGTGGSLPGGTQLASCFSQATSQIQSVSKAASSIFNMFSGGLDTDALLGSLANSITQGACQEINRVTGQAASSYTGGLMTSAGQVSGLGYTAGNAVANQIGGQAGSIVGNTIGSTVNGQMNANSVNPSVNQLGTQTNLNTGGGLGGSTAQAPSFMCSSFNIGC